MVSFKKKSPIERVATMNRLIRKLEREQANEDTPPVDTYDLLRMLRQIVDHLVKTESEWEMVDDDDAEDDDV